MTIFDNIKAMNIDEFAEWLDKNGQFDGSPWLTWFDKKYCKDCEPIEATYEDSDHLIKFSYCELNDTCRFFDKQIDNKEIIKMWLLKEINIG